VPHHRKPIPHFQTLQAQTTFIQISPQATLAFVKVPIPKKVVEFLNHVLNNLLRQNEHTSPINLQTENDRGEL
jgi:hypothetical protein